MYKKQCSYSGCKRGENGQPKEVFTYATSKSGSLPVAYCSKECEANAKYDKRFVENR